MLSVWLSDNGDALMKQKEQDYHYTEEEKRNRTGWESITSKSIDNSDSNRHHRNRGQRLIATSRNGVENKTTTTTIIFRKFGLTFCELNIERKGAYF